MGLPSLLFSRAFHPTARALAFFWIFSLTPFGTPHIITVYIFSYRKVITLLNLGWLRDSNALSLAVRLLLGVIFSGTLGLSRNVKQRAAGMRTYIFVCTGAILTMTLAQYESALVMTRWSAIHTKVGAGIDLSRYGAQVINGIGFLGAGTIILTGSGTVKGITTAAGLWSSACMGLVLGAGFYEGAVIGYLFILSILIFVPSMENKLLRYSRNMNIKIQINSFKHLREVIDKIKGLDISVLDMSIDTNLAIPNSLPTAILYLRTNKRYDHRVLLIRMAEFDEVYKIDEL